MFIYHLIYHVLLDQFTFLHHLHSQCFFRGIFSVTEKNFSKSSSADWFHDVKVMNCRSQDRSVFQLETGVGLHHHHYGITSSSRRIYSFIHTIYTFYTYFRVSFSYISANIEFNSNLSVRETQHSNVQYRDNKVFTNPQLFLQK